MVQVSISFRFPQPDEATDQLTELYDGVEVLDSVDVDGALGAVFTYTRDDGTRIIEIVAPQRSPQADWKPGVIITANSLTDDLDALREDVEDIAESIHLR